MKKIRNMIFIVPALLLFAEWNNRHSEVMWWIISSAIFALGAYQFSKDRILFKDVICMVRKDVPVWLALIRVGFYVIPFTFFPELSNSETAIPFVAVLLLLGGIYLNSYHAHFSQALVCFDSGIQLPDKSTILIPWKDIHAFDYHHEKVSIRFNDESYVFTIDRRDGQQLITILDKWKLALSEAKI